MKTLLFRSSVVAVALVVTLCAAPSRADMMFDSFGAGYAFDPNHTYMIVDRPSFTYQAIAVRFQSPIEQQFTKAVFATSAFHYYNDFTNRMSAMLIVGSDSGPTGPVLEQFDFANPFGPLVVTFNSATHPTLAAGGTYWLAIQPNTAEWPWETYGGWHYSSTTTFTPNNLAHKSSSAGPWMLNGGPQDPPIAAPALQMEGSPVPEPSVLVLIGMGGAGLTFAVRQWKQNRRK